MKITTSILALLVLFLSTQAVFIHGNMEAQKTVARKTCCAKKKACKKTTETNKKDNGCKEGCNPFMSCYGCSYILTERAAFPYALIMNSSVQTGFKQNFFISNYNADCWHPPEIV